MSTALQRVVVRSASPAQHPSISTVVVVVVVTGYGFCEVVGASVGFIVGFIVGLTVGVGSGVTTYKGRVGCTVGLVVGDLVGASDEHVILISTVPDET